MKSSGPIINSPAVNAAPKSYPTAQRPAGGYAAPTTQNKTLGVKVEYTKKWGDWEEMWDAESQAYYFFNSTNGDSAWERPTGWPVV